MIEMDHRYILDDAGDPVACPDLIEWATWMKTGNRHLGKNEWPHPTNPEQRILVSTVFLGLDHNFLQDGPPVLWETMVFGGPLDGKMDRYTSRQAAEEGHARWVKRVEAGINDELV